MKPPYFSSVETRILGPLEDGGQVETQDLTAMGKIDKEHFFSF